MTIKWIELINKNYEQILEKSKIAFEKAMHSTKNITYAVAIDKEENVIIYQLQNPSEILRGERKEIKTIISFQKITDWKDENAENEAFWDYMIPKEQKLVMTKLGKNITLSDLRSKFNELYNRIEEEMLEDFIEVYKIEEIENIVQDRIQQIQQFEE